MAVDAGPLNRLLPWHRPAWEKTQRLLQMDRLPHALLLCGMAGMGKNDFARLLAHALLCASPAADSLPCGGCRACLLMQAGTHPDLYRCTPEEDKTSINIDQVRDVGQFLGLRSHCGGRRIVIITPAEHMNLNAANGLLKMLEEPPPGVHLLLVSSRPAAIPATVRSRCQRLFFAFADRRAALAWLSTQPGTGGADPAILLALAQDAPLKAAAIAAEGQLSRRQAMLGELLSIVRHGTDPLQVAENWLKFDAKASLYWLYGWLVDLIRLQTTDQPPCVSNPDSAKALSELSLGLNTPWLFEQLDLTVQAIQLLDGSISAQLVLEDTLLPWAVHNSRMHDNKLCDINQAPY